MEDCTFGADCPCQWDSVSGPDLDVLFERHPEKDLRGKEISFAPWDGLICPEVAGDPDGICIHSGAPCGIVWFCMSRDGEFEE